MAVIRCPRVARGCVAHPLEKRPSFVSFEGQLGLSGSERLRLHLNKLEEPW